MKTINLDGKSVPLFEYDAIVIGSGAAGYNAADELYSLGKTNIAVVTEGRTMGTSRNTGSDKQTYYKVSTSGGEGDSVLDMAKTLFDGGSMHGDTALIEAAYSQKCFFKLVNYGVPFPYNEYGEYVGYRTDNDTRRRASSCGPLTSKLMTEALERAVLSKNIPVLNGHRVIKILTDNGRAVGVITARAASISEENPLGLCVFAASDVVYAVGGPSAIYLSSVYPESQTCALGAAFEAGAEGMNLTESQYGMASVKFRWNLSGSYQQVIPRYVSLGADGDEREFLRDHFGTTAEMLSAIFMKGYEWPFDPAKVGGGSHSSKIDIAVFGEIRKERRVFLDYTKNPAGFDFSLLSDEAKNYLSSSSAAGKTPIKRLEKLNAPAIALYASHGIDLKKEMLEISVSAQHANGGLALTTDYESTTLKHFYPVGECGGVFGVHRPGGSALNSTQVSSTRAAQKIAAQSGAVPTDAAINAAKAACGEISALEGGKTTLSDILAKRREYGAITSDVGAFMRENKAVCEAIAYFEKEYRDFYKTYSVPAEYVSEAMINRDVIITALTYLSAIRDYIADGGKSRGSYMIAGTRGIDKKHAGKVQYTSFDGGKASSRFEKRRPIPKSEQWFEKVYNKFTK